MIKVFGEQAKAIKEGDEFVAKVGSVEGRVVVILEPKPLHDDSFDDMDGDESLQRGFDEVQCEGFGEQFDSIEEEEEARQALEAGI